MKPGPLTKREWAIMGWAGAVSFWWDSSLPHDTDPEEALEAFFAWMGESHGIGSASMVKAAMPPWLYNGILEDLRTDDAALRAQQ